MRLPAAGLAAALLVAACAGLPVTTTGAPGSNERIPRYRTFGWMPEPASDADEAAVQAGVRKAVADELTRRGYEPAQGSPDFLIGARAALRKQTYVQAVDPNFGIVWNPFFGPPWGAGGTGAGFDPPIERYEQGTVLIDIVDAASGDLTWRGTANADLGLDPSGVQVAQRVDEAATAIASRFPARPPTR